MTVYSNCNSGFHHIFQSETKAPLGNVSDRRSGLQQPGWAKASIKSWMHFQKQRLYLIQHTRTSWLWICGAPTMYIIYPHFQLIYTDKIIWNLFSFLPWTTPTSQDIAQIVRFKYRRWVKVRWENVKKWDPYTQTLNLFTFQIFCSHQAFTEWCNTHRPYKHPNIQFSVERPSTIQTTLLIKTRIFF